MKRNKTKIGWIYFLIFSSFIGVLTIFAPSKQTISKDHESQNLPTSESVESLSLGQSSKERWLEEYEFVDSSGPMLRIVDGRKVAPSSLDQNARRRIVRSIAKSDPHAAIDWLSQLPSEEFDEGIRTIINTISRDYPQDALDLSQAMKPGIQRDRLVAYSAKNLARKDLDEALAWASTLKDGDLKDRVYSQIVVQWAETDLLKAMEFALNEIRDGKHKDYALNWTHRAWRHQEFLKTGKMPESLPR
ncbi:hypothetical protein [Pelagicoccus sp. SDUM812005]|uniref:hypothetical protein n=1 Tax=Pelagicoccus sp. SDUM812005 TaxID=3041257 RepID=UPI00280C8A50|nr:hypothetical protein [Pelagicoccus sp. SDUM812005]MDQ8183416.1 hypothetical protein [Pelagicoccus sp. SDUM812005]